jgi:threonine dehydratase
VAADLPPDAVIGLILCGSNVSIDDVEAWRREVETAGH